MMFRKNEFLKFKNMFLKYKEIKFLIFQESHYAWVDQICGGQGFHFGGGIGG